MSLKESKTISDIADELATIHVVRNGHVTKETILLFTKQIKDQKNRISSPKKKIEFIVREIESVEAELFSHNLPVDIDTTKLRLLVKRKFKEEVVPLLPLEKMEFSNQCEIRILQNIIARCYYHLDELDVYLVNYNNSSENYWPQISDRLISLIESNKDYWDELLEDFDSPFKNKKENDLIYSLKEKATNVYSSLAAEIIDIIKNKASNEEEKIEAIVESFSKYTYFFNNTIVQIRDIQSLYDNGEIDIHYENILHRTRKKQNDSIFLNHTVTIKKRTELYEFLKDLENKPIRKGRLNQSKLTINDIVLDLDLFHKSCETFTTHQEFNAKSLILFSKDESFTWLPKKDFPILAAFLHVLNEKGIIRFITGKDYSITIMNYFSIPVINENYENIYKNVNYPNKTYLKDITVILS